MRAYQRACGFLFKTLLKRKTRMFIRHVFGFRFSARDGRKRRGNRSIPTIIDGRRHVIRARRGVQTNSECDRRDVQMTRHLRNRGTPIAHACLFQIAPYSRFRRYADLGRLCFSFVSQSESADACTRETCLKLLSCVQERNASYTCVHASVCYKFYRRRGIVI